MTAAAIAEPRRPLAETLERCRLEHRAGRVELVLAALRDRATWRATDGAVPEPLRAAIREFEDELRRLRGRLRELAD
ncbi:MAG TPA: hypothetical protein VD931_19285 [Baekduia sp.]|nr:hypothetical protein [Baekduia sp.]